MLVTVHNPCYVPHASRITTWITIFTEILFSVSNEWVRFWSHFFLINNPKTFIKKLLAVCPEKVTRSKNRKKNRISIAKLFAVHENAIISGKIMICISSSGIWCFKFFTEKYWSWSYCLTQFLPVYFTIWFLNKNQVQKRWKFLLNYV